MNEVAAHAFLADCGRMRIRWIETLSPIIGREDAVLLADVVESFVAGERRWLFAGEVAVAESLGTDPRAIDAMIRAKALRTCVLLLAAPDAQLDAVTSAIPCATFAHLCSVAIKLRDHANDSTPTENTKP